MIFVGGMGRSGTSVLMQCLKNSGFNIGTDDLLFGLKYKTEYIPIFHSLGWLFFSWKKGDFSRINGVILFNIATYAILDRIEAIKCLSFAHFLPMLQANNHPIMEDPKFILMSRNIPDAVNSARRVGLDYKGHEFQPFIAAWDKIADGYPTIRIKHDDLINNTKAVQSEVSDFLGKKIDMSIISSKETHAGG